MCIRDSQHEAALRKMGLRAANYLGEAARALTPDETATYELLPLHEYHRRYPDPVSYTHLDVYKRQILGRSYWHHRSGF